MEGALKRGTLAEVLEVVGLPGAAQHRRDFAVLGLDSTQRHEEDLGNDAIRMQFQQPPDFELYAHPSRNSSPYPARIR